MGETAEIIYKICIWKINKFLVIYTSITGYSYIAL